MPEEPVLIPDNLTVITHKEPGKYKNLLNQLSDEAFLLLKSSGSDFEHQGFYSMDCDKTPQFRGHSNAYILSEQGKLQINTAIALAKIHPDNSFVLIDNSEGYCSPEVYGKVARKSNFPPH